VTDDPLWPRASGWLGTGGEGRLGLVGVPLSRTSISPSSAHRTPAAVRAALARFPTWHAGLDVDLPAIVDHGDLDVAELTGRAAVDAVQSGLAALPVAELLVLLGGDNLVTWPAVRALAGDLGRVGVLTLDAHHDVRGFHAGPTNGTPIRGLMEAGLRGRNVVQVGIAELTNSREYREWCAARDATAALGQRHHPHVAEVVRRQLDRLAEDCDWIYVDLDVDVVDRAFAPGCPGARPGGLQPHELLDAAVEAGRHRAVRAVDVVEVDAAADRDELTVQLAAMCLLSTAAGYASR
jgi:formiminoglutamase